MNILNRNILIAATALTAVTAQAQTEMPDDNAKSKWSVEASGGAGSFWELRSANEISNRYVAPAFTLGARYQLKPWVRLNATLGYMQMKYNFTNNPSYTTTKDGFAIGDRTATLTTTTIRNNSRNHVNAATAEIGADFDMFNLLWKNRKAQAWHLILGTGVGYMHMWHQNNSVWATNEEAVAKGDDYFNVYNHSYVTDIADFQHKDLLFVPGRLGVELDVTHNITLGVRADYKWLPLNKELTPKHMLNGMFSFAYTFDAKGNSRSALIKRYKDIIAQDEAEIARLNSAINSLRADKDNAEAQARRAQADLDKTKKALEECENRDCEGIGTNSVFFAKNQSTIDAEQKKTIEAVAKMLQDEPDTRIVVNGYASTEGNEQYNQKLSEARVKAVCDMLINEYGISESRISSSAHGATDKIYKTFDLNRVAIINIVK